MMLPDDDERLSTFVISASGAGFCLQECRGDVLRGLGEFATLVEVITGLRRAMSDQTGPRAGAGNGQAAH